MQHLGPNNPNNRQHTKQLTHTLSETDCLMFPDLKFRALPSGDQSDKTSQIRALPKSLFSWPEVRLEIGELKWLMIVSGV